MDIQSYRAFDPTSTVPVAVATFTLALRSAIDRFLGYVEEHHAGSPGDLLATLRDQMHQLAGPGQVGSADDLAQAFVGAILEVSESVLESEEPTEILKTRLTSLQYLYRYAEAQTLINVLGREKGIAAAKAYLDWAIEQRPPNRSGPDSIAEMRERDIPWNLDDKGQDAISALVSEYQCMKKVTACRTHMVLKHLPDKDVAEAIACYPDHASLRRANPNFRLTRSKTLMGGASYCDTCFHDVRRVQDPLHPPGDQFDRLTHDES